MMEENYCTESEQELCQLLIQLDLLTHEQVNDAFNYLCRLPKSELKPIEAILVELELISPTMLEQVKLMYQQARQTYVRGSGPLELVVPPKYPAKHKKGQDNAVLQTRDRLSKARSNQSINYCKTSELSLTPELQAIIKGESHASTPKQETPPAAAEIPAWALASANTPVSLDKTMAYLPEAHTSDLLPAGKGQAASPQPGAADAIAELPYERLEPINLVMRPAQNMNTMPTIPISQPKQLASPALESKPCNTAKPISQVPVQASRAESDLRLPDMTARLPKGMVPPQLGQILLKNHEIEEWQLMHALCIQKEAPQTTPPRLGILLIKLGYVNRQTIERALSIQLAEELHNDACKAS